MTVSKYLQDISGNDLALLVSRGAAAFADDLKSFRPVSLDIKAAEATSVLQSQCSTWHIPEVRPSTSQTGDAVRINAGF